MPNTNVLNPIADMYQTQLEVTRQFADTLFSGTEKIDHVIINATHRALTEQLRLAQALAAVRDPRGLASLQSMLVPHPENAANCQREVLQVFAEIFNLPNFSTILTLNETVGPNYFTPGSIVQGRRLQLGARVDW